MRAWLLAAGLLVSANPAAPVSEYDLTWTAFARQAAWQEREARPVVAGERSGQAVARFRRVAPNVFRLEWTGPDGRGGGLIGPGGPTRFTFPSPLPIAGPPPLRHLSGGAFEFDGDPERPETFRVSYVEGFICRSPATACDGIAMWERRFEGHGRRR